MKVNRKLKHWLTTSVVAGGVLLASAAALAENWIPIDTGSITIFIPQINFTVVQSTPGYYDLSWNAQSGATNYKVERLVVDQSVTEPTSTIATIWQEVANVTTTSISQTFDLSMFDFGGHQDYRLSSCDGTTCTLIEELYFFVDKSELINSIPQNIAMTQTVSSAIREQNSTSDDDHKYAIGRGFSFLTGHANPNANATATANVKNTRLDITGGQSVTYQGDQHDVTLSWDNVADATHYVVSRIPDRGDSPTYNRLTQYPAEFEASGNTYNLQLTAGIYEFVVYACRGRGYCGLSSSSVLENVPVTADVDHLPTNFSVTLSGDQQSINLSWDPPAFDANDVTSYEVVGELRNVIANVPVYAGRTLTRNAVTHNLAPGRQYCYTVKAIFNTTSRGDSVPGQCVSLGGASVLPAPDDITIVAQSKLGMYNQTYANAYVIRWSAVSGADYYQLDRALDMDGTWTPVYVGTGLYTEQLFTQSQFEGFRVSACTADGVCGDYRRLYFDAQAQTLTSAELYSPACLVVPESIDPGETLTVSWCYPYDTNVTEFELVDINANAGGNVKTAPGNFGTTLQGLVSHDIASLAQGTDYCFDLKAYFSAQGSGYNYDNNGICGVVTMTIPTAPTLTIDNASQGNFTLNWPAATNASHYIVQEAVCDTNCGSVAEGDWETLSPDTMVNSLAFIQKGNGHFAYRIAACSSDTNCSGFSQQVTTSVNRRMVIFTLTDVLGSPVVETDENGDAL